ncbi:TetR/AcrR family transcriptional regulator [Sphingobium baderi]|uniref:HTH tetR-type domain-containing protein n=1 Tax=Sphingobium baderi LL03 TaxID=1114964 RepID=T0GET9_9SPHN|nr:TetR/AcrR family transcriptional regulator [Sphingobium baderi]EQA98567.1 hypothetical protein L485_17945 [Sphingobium baderi LL03]EQA98577.1 hypothetical protein L485_17995 [Sphingobium baderi LL03]KMS61605.1 hypothetical protein V475_12450 [Sphingobium baderi LL03]KMS61615.1 hypothetical protein V475_12500 [Sphingobium baderi LL03]
MFHLTDGLELELLGHGLNLSQTKRRLLSVGEVMMGTSGLDGVALHRIAAEAGQANRFAVQYHFQSKADFVNAILATRVAQVERRRSALLARAQDRNLADDPRVLLELLYLPYAEQVDSTGACVYACFCTQLALQHAFGREAVKHPLIHAGDNVTTDILLRITRVVPHLPEDLVISRVLVQTRQMMAALIEHHARTSNYYRWIRSREVVLLECIDMTHAAIATEARPEVIACVQTEHRRWLTKNQPDPENSPA